MSANESIGKWSFDDIPVVNMMSEGDSDDADDEMDSEASSVTVGDDEGDMKEKKSVSASASMSSYAGKTASSSTIDSIIALPNSASNAGSSYSYGVSMTKTGDRSTSHASSGDTTRKSQQQKRGQQREEDGSLSVSGAVSLSNKQAKKFSCIANSTSNDQDMRDEIERSKTARECNLAGLQISIFPDKLPLNTLVKLDLSENELESLPGCAFQARCGSQLREIDLHSNALVSLPSTLFRLPRLEVLSLSHNRLRQLPMQAAGRERNRTILPALHRIDLEFNDLGSFPIELLNNCSQLEQLLLSQNDRMFEGELTLHSLLANSLLAARHVSLSTQKRLLLKIDNLPELVQQAREQSWGVRFPWLDLQFHKIYPDKIIDYLYVGSLRTVQTLSVYRLLGIRNVLTVARDMNVVVDKNMTHLVLPLNDFPEENPSLYFDEAFAFIDAARNAKRGVLVHCFAGLSRSVTIVVAYLMRKCGITCDEAMALVRRHRPAARPNEGFMKALNTYEHVLRDKNRDALSTKRLKTIDEREVSTESRTN